MASRMMFLVSRGLPKRWVRASSMVAPLSDPVSYIPDPPGTPAAAVSNFGPVQVTRLSNGVTVATRESNSPFSNVGVYIRSGSRAEEYEQRGVAHLTANCGFLSTSEKTGITIRRQLEHLGVKFNCTNTREFIAYNALMSKGTEDVVVDVFGSLVCSPALHHWEISDDLLRLPVLRNKAFSNPGNVVMEELHKYSFRSGLSNSLYCPEENDTKFDSESIRSFMNSYYIGQNINVIGVGVNHEEFVSLAKKSFNSLPDRLPRPILKAEYVGGGEVRINRNTDKVVAIAASNGASLTGDPKDLMCSRILQQLLGEKEHVKWGSGSAASRYNKAVAAKVDGPFQIGAVNINYSDNGLFGMYAVAHGKAIRQVLKSAMSEFAEVAKGNFTSEDLARAKNQVKTAVFSDTETQSCDVYSIARQVAFSGSYSDLKESAVDSITAGDISKFAKAVFAARPNLVVYGNLCDTPRLDELVAGISVK